MNRSEIVSRAACALGIAAAAAAGCGGASPPLRAQAETLAAVRSAEDVGASRSPEASYHLELANEQVAQAEQLIARGRMEDAERTLERAKADAELAIALSREAEARADAEQTREHIRALRAGQL